MVRVHYRPAFRLSTSKHDPIDVVNKPLIFHSFFFVFRSNTWNYPGSRHIAEFVFPTLALPQTPVATILFYHVSDSQACSPRTRLLLLFIKNIVRNRITQPLFQPSVGLACIKLRRLQQYLQKRTNNMNSYVLL